MQPGFNFSVPPVDPQAEPVAPHQGTTVTARHASWTGAQSQVNCWTAKQSELLQCLAAGGAMSRNELAAVLKWPLSSVCSVLHAVSDRVESNGDFEAVTWANGHTTRRERFRVKR
jgi:hypothetical protein